MSSFRIPFVSLTGNLFELRIYPSAEGYDATNATQLYGGREPFVTEDTDNTDILSPVRSSTGYITIVTEDITLQSRIMPTSADGMRVTLLRYAREDESDKTTRVEWEGYIRPESFTQEWCAGPWEIQIPVVSRLGMIMNDYLSDGNTGLVTIGEWLNTICGDVYKHVVIPDNELAHNGSFDWGGTVESPTVLQLAFSESIFKSAIKLQDRDNPNNTTSGLWDPGIHMDIATSVCTMTRWVMREDGDTLICDDPGHTGSYLKYSAGSLRNLYPQAEASVTLTDLRIEELGNSWADTHLCGDDGTRDSLMPYGRVTIEGATGTYDTTLTQVTSEDWQKVGGIPYVNGAPASYNRPDTVPFSLYGDDSVTVKTQRVLDNPELTTYQYWATIAPGYNPGLKNSMIYGNIYPYVVQGQGVGDPGALEAGDLFGGGEISCIHYFYERKNSYVHYRINSIVLGRVHVTTPSLPAVKIRTTLAQLVPYSSRTVNYISLCLSGTVYRGETWKDIDIAESFEGNDIYALKVGIKVGDYYIYKDTWGSHVCSLHTLESPFEILWTKEDKGQFKEYIRLTQQADMPIAIDAPIEITIYTPTNATRSSGQEIGNASDKYLRIDNFQVRICEQEVDDNYDFSETLVKEQKSDIKFSKRIGSNRLQEYQINTRFGGPDNPAALFCNNPVTISGTRNMKYFQARMVGTLNGDNDGARYLCKRTFEWLCTQASHNRQVLKISLRTERPWSLPEPLRIGDSDGGYVPVAKTRHWRDDQTTLTLIQTI